MGGRIEKIDGGEEEDDEWALCISCCQKESKSVCSHDTPLQKQNGFEAEFSKQALPAGLSLYQTHFFIPAGTFM
jgi:hypothetical protein